MSTNTSDFVVGIDFGGTKVALATATTEGVIIQQQTLATNAEQGAEQVVERPIAGVYQLIE